MYNKNNFNNTENMITAADLINFENTYYFFYFRKELAWARKIKDMGEEDLELLAANEKIVYVRDLSSFAITAITNDFFSKWKREYFLFKGDFYFLEFKKEIEGIGEIKIIFKSFSKFFKNNNDIIREKFNIDFETIKKEDNAKTVRYKTFTNLENITILMENYMKIVWRYDPCWKEKRLSSSSSAIGIFSNKKNNFNNHRIEISQDLREEEIFRKSFFGGRNEVFGNSFEGEYLYYYDFPLMYGNIMKNHNFAYGNWKFVEKVKKIKERGLYMVSYYDNNSIPTLPCRTAKEGLVFPRTTETLGLYWGEQLALLVSRGGKINKVYGGFEFEKYGKIFSKFAYRFVKKRDDGLFEKVICKEILVSFYGRLGLNKQRSETIFLSYDEYRIWCQKNEDKDILQEMFYKNYATVVFEPKEEKLSSEKEKLLVKPEELKKLKKIFENLSERVEEGEIKMILKKKKILIKRFIEKLFNEGFKLKTKDVITEEILENLKKEFVFTENVENVLRKKIEYEVEFLKFKNRADVKLAAQISMKAQNTMLSVIDELLKNKIRILYIDNDCIFIASKENIDGRTVAGITWSEKTKIKKAIFASNKLYSFIKNDGTEETRAAGVTKESEIRNFKAIKEGFLKDNYLKEMILKNPKRLQLDGDLEIFINLTFNKYKKRLFDKYKIQTEPLFNPMEDWLLDSWIKNFEEWTKIAKDLENKRNF